MRVLSLWPTVAVVAIAAALLGPLSAAATGQEGGARRDFQIVARNYAFSPATLEVQQDDLVKVTLRAEDAAHSFTIDEYRIAKRVGRGETVTFEFRADRPGRFRFYCNLKHDEGCRDMAGDLIVRAR